MGVTRRKLLLDAARLGAGALAAPLVGGARDALAATAVPAGLSYTPLREADY